MNFRDLEYLAAVADHLHFGQAASACHVSQSTLSLQLQKLEAGLGVQLIERTNRRVVFTAAGQAFVSRARDILRARQEMMDEAEIEAGQMPAEITLGLIPTIAPYRLGAVLTAMKKACPDTLVRVVEDVTGELEKGVATGRLDAAILATDCGDALIEATWLMDDELLLAVPAGHPLAARKRRMDPGLISGDKLLLLKDGHCLRDQALDYCTAHGSGRGHESVATSIETLLTLVRHGAGVTLIPKMTLDHRPSAAGVVFVKLNPPPMRRIRLMTRKTSRLGHRLAKVLMAMG
ncbi:LysR substrate-binding domain-containing protein [Prosthecobacter sp. SYSU 5D2]|uniref:LysR substrate-binding domain-containing protein n=1 Tax=Prosthecobacter sp. SYSU 5D2 TaxID=3134134 RepID=UPI0031FF0964